MIKSVVRENPAFWSFDFIGAIITTFFKILMRILRFSIKYFSQFAEKAPTQKNKFDKDFLRLMYEKVCIYHYFGASFKLRYLPSNSVNYCFDFTPRNQVVLTGSWVRIPPLPPKALESTMFSRVFHFVLVVSAFCEWCHRFLLHTF